MSAEDVMSNVTTTPPVVPPTGTADSATRESVRKRKIAPAAPGEEPSEPRLARIARRAHELYEARGGQDGRDLDDWLQAEREIDADVERERDRQE